MTRLTAALSLLLLCSTSVYATEPQRQGIRELATEGPATTAPTEDATADGSTIVPSDGDTDSPSEAKDTTDAPSGEGSTVMPTQDSEDADTVVPSTLAPTDPPMKDADPPTEAPVVVTEAPTDGEDEITGGPTEAPTADMTLSPTEADVEAVEDLECTPGTYTVMVDLEINFQNDDVAQCTTGEETMIGNTISQTMQDEFPDVATSWDGTAQFHGFDFDDAQFVDDISEVANGRQLRGRMMEAAKRLAAKRRRADVFACPLRGDYLCPSGYCMWGCVEVTTTNCGGDDSTDQWEDLDFAVQKAVKKLKYDCLGNPGQLGVMVTLNPGTTEAPTEELGVRTMVTDAPTLSPVKVFDDEGEVISIKTTFSLNYFKGQGGDLNGHSKLQEQLMEELNQFVEGVVWVEPEYAATFNGMNEDETTLTHSWDEVSRTLTLHFSTQIFFTTLADETDHDLAHVITSKGDFHKFLKKLREHNCVDLDQSECNQWMRGIHSVVFQGTGTGRRLSEVEVFAEEDEA